MEFRLERIKIIFLLMILEIQIEKNIIRLILKERKIFVDKMVWEIDRNLSQNLLVNIEKFLKKNKLNVADLEKMKLRSDIAENFTTFRIVKAVADTINFSLEIKNNPE